MNRLQVEHESATILAFIAPDKRKRYLSFVSNANLRHKFTRELAHFHHLDPRFIKSIPPRCGSPDGISAILRGKGAGDLCLVISQWDKFDGREMSLDEALRGIVGYGMGTFLSCIPGKLAYFEDEDQRFILER